MKAEAGWGAAALVAVAAALVGVTSQSGGRGAPEARPRSGGAQSAPGSTATPKSAFADGPCGDLESRLKTFLLASTEEIAAPESCYAADSEVEQKKDAAYDENRGAALREGAASLRYVIAIVPDPLHTNFSLSFDRLIEAIQQGAQDEDYLYDSSWMPWETEKPSLALLDDQDKLDDRTKARENQPGIILFRKQPAPDNSKPSQSPPLYGGEPYCDGLAVFVVGEEPTGGIHKRQFENAATWINALQPRVGGSARAPSYPVKILGPTFSGSLPSLAQMLLFHDFSPAIPRRGSEEAKSASLEIHSGGVTSKPGVEWFAQQVPGARFRSYQESDTQLLENYRHYLVQQGFKLSHLAIVSEDETAFGGFGDHPPECEPERSASGPGKSKDQPSQASDDPGSKPDEADAGNPGNPTSHVGLAPACVFYPRDISALRSAYQKQSIFNGGSGNGGSSDKIGDVGQRTLSTDLADPDDEDHDTVRNYSGNQTALSQEAALQQIVSVLRAHESEYVVLRSSNPLDQLFLSHYLRLAYPQGRVVLDGSDLLLRRESGAATLSGIMTLTTYPLLPWESHWASFNARPIQAMRHSHRVFSQDLAEATYVAIRFLLHVPTAEQIKALKAGAAGPGKPKDAPGAEEFFLPANRIGLELAEYGPPFWLRPDCLKDASGSCSDPASRRPTTWLSVLGRDGFWPVAALPTADGKPGEPKCDAAGDLYARPCLKTRLLGAMFAWRRLFSIRDTEARHGGWPEWPPMPLSMKVFLVLIFLWAIFHLQCCANPSLMVKPGYRAYFVRVPRGHHLGLIVLGSFFVALVPVFLEWGYGAMSQDGEPVHLADAYRFVLFVVWLMCGAAVFANAWKESALESAPESAVTRWGAIEAWLWQRRGIWKVVAWYIASTCFAYCLVDFSFNESLGVSNALPTYWRSINLTNGVSPLAPLIALCGGLYLWFWHSLQGLAFFNDDSPLLPTRFQLDIVENDEKSRSLRMFSREEAGMPLESLCRPFAREFWLAFAVLFPTLLAIGRLAASDVPFRSLGSKEFSSFFGVGVAICAALMLANSWQLLRIWLRLRQLLVLLDRLHLRRTMDALRGFSWGSVWRMSGRVLDIRYKLLSRQTECLTHLQNSCRTCGHPRASAWLSQLDETQQIRKKFAKWFSDNWDDAKERDLDDFFQAQRSIAKAGGVVLAQVLVPHWRTEDASLIQKLPKTDDDAKGEAKGDAARGQTAGGDGEDRKTGGGPPNYIRNAEELVCLVYLGFIQNILGRMRTIVMQIACLFVAAAIAVASYPFDPRSEVSGSMVILFLVLGTAIVTVYSQMHRDSTLSLVTDTTPGELGADFWFKLIGFGLGPILGLMATIFPELPGSLFSWLQPGLNSIK